MLILADSIGVGYGSNDPSTQSWPAQSQSLLSSNNFSNLQAGNFSASGFTLRQIIDQRLPLAINARDDSYGQYIIVIGGPHNDLAQQVPNQTIYDQTAELCTKIKAAFGLPGKTVRIIMQSALPTQRDFSKEYPGFADLPTYEANRRAVNNYRIVNYKTLGAFNYKNFNADSRLGNALDTNFFSGDKQHPNGGGYLAMAQDMVREENATQAGIELVPEDDLVAAGAINDAPTANNLVAQPATFVGGVNVDISGNTVTLNSENGKLASGYSGGAYGRYAIGGHPTATVLGYCSFQIYHADGEFVAGLNNGANEGFDWPEIEYAEHLATLAGSAGQGVRPFGAGTGSSADNAANFSAFTDGDTILIVRENKRVAWYRNNKLVTTVPNTDITSTWFFDVAIRGLGSKIRNVRIAAANLVDLGEPAPPLGTDAGEQYAIIQESPNGYLANYQPTPPNGGNLQTTTGYTNPTNTAGEGEGSFGHLGTINYVIPGNQTGAFAFKNADANCIMAVTGLAETPINSYTAMRWGGYRYNPTDGRFALIVEGNTVVPSPALLIPIGYWVRYYRRRSDGAVFLQWGAVGSAWQDVYQFAATSIKALAMGVVIDGGANSISGLPGKAAFLCGAGIVAAS